MLEDDEGGLWAGGRHWIKFPGDAVSCPTMVLEIGPGQGLLLMHAKQMVDHWAESHAPTFCLEMWTKAGVVAHRFNPSTQEVGSGNSPSQFLIYLHICLLIYLKGNSY